MNHTGMKLSDFNPAIRAQIEAQLKGGASATLAMRGGTATQFPAVASSGLPGAQMRMVRQNSSGLNKTEAEFLEYLRALNPGATIRVQEITLKLANGVRYTPDFVIFNGVRGTAYETKGFMRDDASAKIKFAARLWPEFQFILVAKRNRKQGGGWRTQEILP